MSARNTKATRARREARRRRAPRPRRGVLLLVVLSMLVLFSLLGAAFLSTSSSHRSATKVRERAHRSSLQPGDLMERALMQVLRDTNNPHSSIRYHSLLRDMYGTDGFAGRVYAPNVGSAFGDPNTPADPAFDAMPRYARSVTDATSGVLGPSEGQLIDLYIDSATLQGTVEATALLPDDAGPFELELDANGVRVEHRLPVTDGYYNGSLLTFTSGPARGRTTRVVDYDYVGDQTQFLLPNGSPSAMFRLRVVAFPRADGAGLAPNPIGGPRPLELEDLVSVTAVDLNGDGDTADAGESPLYFGHSFVVSGRPFNGTGVGYNTLADIAAPRLTAGELLPINSGFMGDPSNFVPVALAPNARYPLANGVQDPLSADLDLGTDDFIPYDTYAGPGGVDESYDAPDYQNLFLAWQALAPRARARVINPATGLPEEAPQYYADPSSPPPAPARLDLEETTIPSFHRPALVNYWMQRLFNAPWLAGFGELERAKAILQPYGRDLTPGTADDHLGAGNVAVAAQIAAIKRKVLLRPLPEDHPNFTGSNPTADGLARFNYGAATNPPFGNAAQLVSFLLGGEITFPFWEATGPWDVDNDNDGVPDSIWVDLGMPVQKTEDGRFYKPLFAILVQDLDGRLNTNVHGTASDLAGVFLDPSRNSAGVGLAANLPMDASLFSAAVTDAMDGSIDDLSFLRTSDQLPRGGGWGTAEISLRPVLSPNLPRQQLELGRNDLVGDPRFDSYARLLVGRQVFDPTAAARPLRTPVLHGRLGSQSLAGAAGGAVGPGVAFDLLTPTTYELRTEIELFGYPAFDPVASRVLLDPANPTLTAAQKDALALLGGARPSAFGSTPDLRGRYAVGLNAAGGQLLESARDFNDPGSFASPQLADTPYEVNVMAGSRREPPSLGSDPAVDFDAPFSIGELERLLRPFDADAARLPDRLWELVDDFDPNKLTVPQSIEDAAAASDGQNGVPTADLDGLPAWAPNSAQLVRAQLQAEENRRSVTARSFDVPAAVENWQDRLRYGADGLPGVPGFDDDGNGAVDDAGDYLFVVDMLRAGDFATLVALYNAAGCDDYAVILGSLPPEQPRLLDYLRYRITLQLIRDGVLEADSDAVDGDDGNDTLDPDELLDAGGASLALRARVEEQVSLIINGADDVRADEVRTNLASFGGLVAPEVLAGLKMDLNRPFGDGRDNNGNGVVDEPQEAGEPWIDLNGDGVWEAGEPFLDLDGDGRFYADRDGDGVLLGDEAQDGLDSGRDLDGFPEPADTDVEPIFDSLFAADDNNNDVIEPGEYARFDHAGGRDANGRGAFTPAGARIHDDMRMARQLYARHLYCLMLALVDEAYLAPVDPSDAQALHYVDPRSGRIATNAFGGEIVGQPHSTSSPAYRIAFQLLGSDPASVPAPTAGAAPTVAQQTLLDAERIARRKLTLRRFAQWAVNCVDARDADVIQTPFEYDENPWDGWNVVDTANGGVYPLDGDLTTDENDAAIRNLVDDADNDDIPNGFDPDLGVERLLPDNTFVLATDQTRGVVWGAERPELLINEGFALHDRRQEDLAFEANEAGQQDFKTTGPVPDDQENDDTLDQRLLPHGVAFIEVHNPNGADSQRPAELYRDEFGLARRIDINKDLNNGQPYSLADSVNAELPVEGVLLDKLSNGYLDTNGNNTFDPGTDQRSPVWRVIVVEEHPELRNEDGLDNASTTRDWSNVPSRFRNLFGWRDQSTGQPVTPRLIDPDFPTFNPHYRPRGRIVDGAGLRLEIEDRPAYVEREAYFVAGARRPVRGYEIPGFGSELRGAEGTVGDVNPFIDLAAGAAARPIDDFRLRRAPGEDDQVLVQSLPPTAMADPNEDGDLTDRILMAPILPGHYGVIGSAGFDYPSSTALDEFDEDGEFNRRFISTIGRLSAARSPGDTGDPGVTPNADGVVLGGPDPAGGVPNSQTDPGHEPGATRRIELVPHPNPYLHQVLVADNGGTEFDILGPRATASADGRSVNVTDPTRPGDGQTLREFNEDPTRPTFFNNGQGGAFQIDPTDVADDGDLERYQVKPAVAFPLEGFSLSQRVDNYFLRYTRLVDSPNARRMNPVFANGEGAFVNAGGETPNTPNPFTTPFDTEPELRANHTTPAYRTVHLQRLANPLLVWNPLPGAPGHQPALPVNPYLTVDSLAVDLTAINGTARDSALSGDAGPGEPGGPPPILLGADPAAAGAAAASAGAPTLTMASTQRGDRTTSAAVDGAPLAARSLWRQERRSSEAELRANYLEPATDVINASAGNLGNPDNAYGRRLDAAVRPDQHYVEFPVRHTLGFANVRFERNGGRFERLEELNTADFNNTETVTADAATYPIDITGDGVGGDLLGTPKLSAAADPAYPWLTWHNRPFASAGELLQVPAASASAMLRDFSTFDSASAGASPPANPYDGDALVNDANGRTGAIDGGDNTTEADDADAARTNAARHASQRAPFGHLLNFFQSATRVSAAEVVNGELVSAGAPNLHRLLDYVHVPSRFVGTDRLANPVVFNPIGPDGVAGTLDDVAPNDPRGGLLAPFNRLPEYREPGRVNLNTAAGKRQNLVLPGGQISPAKDPLSATSPVYDGVMHRFNDGNLYNAAGGLERLGHRGPAWRDVVVSRRGYVDPAIVAGADLDPRTFGDNVADTSAMTLNPNVPTFFGNPFRGSGEGDFVPLSILRQLGAESSLMRSHPISPGDDGAWGTRGADDDARGFADGVVDDASEAGQPASNDFLLFDIYPDTANSGAVALDRIRPGVLSPSGGAMPVSRDLATLTDDPATTQTEDDHFLVNQPSYRVPLFSASDRDPGIDGERNSALRYAPITRLSNLVTTRSNVYAVWITVGFFEVAPAPDWNHAANNPSDPNRAAVEASIRARFSNDRAAYDRVYPDGYQLGAELGSETGETRRFKSFFVIDRTLPVGFRPGDDLNVEDAVLLRRRVE